jgi:hypothetical protein
MYKISSLKTDFIILSTCKSFVNRSLVIGFYFFLFGDGDIFSRFRMSRVMRMSMTPDLIPFLRLRPSPYSKDCKVLGLCVREYSVICEIQRLLAICQITHDHVLLCSWVMMTSTQNMSGEILTGAISHSRLVLHGSWCVPMGLFCMAQMRYFRATGMIFPRLPLHLMEF